MYSHMCQLSVLYITRFIYGLWCMRGNLILSCFLLNVVFVCFFFSIMLATRTIQKKQKVTVTGILF